MTYYEYMAGRQLDADDTPFYGLIQAAMRRADTDNLLKLQAAWPEVWRELRERYSAPGGMLPDELAAEQERQSEGGAHV